MHTRGARASRHSQDHPALKLYQDRQAAFKDTFVLVSLTCAGIDRNTPLITVNVAVLAEQSNMVGKRILRKREVLERLGIRKTTLHESFIKTGRLRLVRIGARVVGVIEDELDALIEELRRERDRMPPAAGEHRAADADEAR
jgi:predicted DNA-binding transcriptional regulator AlpA